MHRIMKINYMLANIKNHLWSASKIHQSNVARTNVCPMFRFDFSLFLSPIYGCKMMMMMMIIMTMTAMTMMKIVRSNGNGHGNGKIVNMTVKCVNCSINGYQVFLMHYLHHTGAWLSTHTVSFFCLSLSLCKISCAGSCPMAWSA